MAALYLHMWDSSTITVTMPLATTTLGALKRTAAHAMGVQVCEVRVSHEGKGLGADAMTLVEANVRACSTIYITSHLNGGMNKVNISSSSSS